MSHRQLISPNLNPVIHENGRVLLDWFGWCLAYVHTAYGTSSAGLTAQSCWNSHTVNRHPGEQPPSGVYVPIFFSGYGGMGHVAIYYNGRVYSAPWHHKATYDEMSSIAETAHIYNVVYLGWAEGMAGKQFVEAVAPAPVAPPAPPVPKYTIVETYPTGKLVELNKQPTHLWGMNYDFSYMVNHPVETHQQGEVITVANKVHHVDGYDYYRRDGQVDGFNVADCTDYTPPPPKPYVAPQGAAQAPPATKYSLVTTVMTFKTADDAKQHNNAQGTLNKGDYYLFASDGIGRSISLSNMDTQPVWINVLDNVVPVLQPMPPSEPVAAVVPEVSKQFTSPMIRASYRPIFEDGHGLEVIAKQNLLITDIVGPGKPINVTKGSNFMVYGTFTDGQRWYAMPKVKGSDPQASNYMYGCPVASSSNFEPYLEDLYGVPERIAYGWQAFYDKTKDTLEGIFRPRKINK